MDVAAWAAVVSADSAEQFGAAADVAGIPEKERRRLPAFARDMIRCTLPLLSEAAGAPVVLGASHGDMHSTVKLLTDLANREIPSPSLFALSVHNAAPGAMSLSLPMPGDQTALAAGANTLTAALTEAYAKLIGDDAGAVVVAFAEPKLPAVYADHDETAPGVFVSLLLRVAAAEAKTEIPVGFGRAGAVEVVRALDAGARRLRFASQFQSAVAA